MMASRCESLLGMKRYLDGHLQSAHIAKFLQERRQQAARIP